MTLFRRLQPIKCYYCQSTVASSPSSASFPTFGIASSSNSTFDPNQFRCPYCGCWNRYNSRGEIVGDEPAMHDERLNIDSYSKRGSPDRNHLPSVHSSGNSRFFCHTCQTNQTLLVNLLSSYLPDPNDPLYNSRVTALPQYTASLQLRYPPVCPSCLPAVEEEIKRKDEMARTRALAGALKASNPRGKNLSAKQLEKKAKLKSWRVRGTLWIVNLVVVITGYVAVILGYRIPSTLARRVALCPLTTLTSLLWVFWDPTYSLQKHSDFQGRRVRVEGRKTYIILQSLSWISRLITSLILFCGWYKSEWDILAIESSGIAGVTRKELFVWTSLTLEVTVLLLSYFSITIHRPAPIRLIDTSASRALSLYPESAPQSSTNAAFSSRTQSPMPSVPGPASAGAHSLAEPDLFATLSLSSNPIITNYANSLATNPMFGRPSLNFLSADLSSHSPDDQQPKQLLKPPATSAQLNKAGPFDGDDDDYDDRGADQSKDQDAMDWEPLSPKPKIQRAQNNGKTSRALDDDGSWLRQQRFFPPEEPTGLEGLLMRTRLVDEDENKTALLADVQRMAGQGPFRWHWGWVYSASALPVLILVIALWINSNAHS